MKFTRFTLGNNQTPQRRGSGLCTRRTNTRDERYKTWIVFKTHSTKGDEDVVLFFEDLPVK